MNNPLKKIESVEVFSDMTFYIVDTLDGKLCWQTLYTNALYSLVDTLKSINDMHKDATLIACCYRQYEGSYNVEVDPVKQYERIYEYANRNYKTFLSKALDANLSDSIVLKSRKEVLESKLNEVESDIARIMANINKNQNKEDKWFVNICTEQLDKARVRKDNILDELELCH